MSALHAALKVLGPVDFSEIPTDIPALGKYLDDLFVNSELILESIPIAEPDSDLDNSLSSKIVASSASEVKLSGARSARPAEEPAALQKEWGKAVKIGAKENPLGMSVYKLSAKDGRGAWFARRSVHQGIGFSKFKRSLQQEFEQSLAIHGAPGEGNVRGIGGEVRVEQIDVPGKGTVEVYRLSAQFPGPTTPRDFVTLLVTSDEAMSNGDARDKASSVVVPHPRHYMIISKPCNHPETQPHDGFVRGSYESVEFIREVPRSAKASQSTSDLDKLARSNTATVATEAAGVSSKDAQVNSTRQRSTTLPHSSSQLPEVEVEEEDTNPVEWIMVTRSDPGGSVPRFMVERGTPGSICTDAVKFLDWACQNKDDKVETSNSEDQARTDTLATPTIPHERRSSFQSFRSSRVAGLEGNEQSQVGEATGTEPSASEIATDQPDNSGGLLGAVYGAASSLSAYTPQVVLDRLPGGGQAGLNLNVPQEQQSQRDYTDGPTSKDGNVDDDRQSIMSSTSFASAEDHLESGEDDSAAQNKSSMEDNTNNEPRRPLTHHEKELVKLTEQRVALTAKFAQSKSKLEASATDQAARDTEQQQKAMDKHNKELRKHEEKYEKELHKLEERQQKERRKLEEKKRKAEDKDEKTRLTRERDEVREELALLKKEADVLRKAVEDLQKENTALVVRLGKIEGLTTNGGSGGSNINIETGSTSGGSINTGVMSEQQQQQRNRSRSSSLKRLALGKDKDKDKVKDKTRPERSMSNLRQSQETINGEA